MRATLCLLAFSAGFIAGCNDPKPPVKKDAPGAGGSSAPQPSAASSVPKAPRSPHRPLPAAATCRVVKATGNARVDGGQTIRIGLGLTGNSFIELEKGARVVVRHGVSTREVEFVGPARARPCVEGEENVLLSRGQVRSVTGPGARPGAQVLVAHPGGTVSYGNAQIDITVTGKSATVVANAGEAWLTAAEGSKLRGPAHLTKGKTKATVVIAGTAQELLQACEQAAKASEEMAKAVLKSPGPDAGPLGTRAASHLKARQAARAACFSAGAAAGLVTDPAEQTRLSDALKSANTRWNSVPKVGP